MQTNLKHVVCPRSPSGCFGVGVACIGLTVAFLFLTKTFFQQLFDIGKPSSRRGGVALIGSRPAEDCLENWFYLFLFCRQDVEERG